MTDDKRFSSKGLLRVDVDVDTRDVTAVWTDTEEIVVRGSNIDAVVEADELFITSEAGRRHNTHPIQLEIPVRLSGCEFKVERGDVHLLRAQGKVDIKLDSGDVSIQEGVGSLAIASGKGEIRVDDYAGDVTVSSGSGDTSLKDVNGTVTVRSGKGDVDLTGGQGAITVAVGSGDVRVENRDCDDLTVAGAHGDATVTGGRVGRGSITTASGDIRCHAQLSVAGYEFTASSGDISISVPRGLAARVDAATSRGNVTTELPLVVINQRGPRNPHGKRLVGSTSDASERADITLRTSSGDIDVSWAASAVPFGARLSRRNTERESDIGGVSTSGSTSRSGPETSRVTTQPNRGEETGFTPASSSDDDRKRAILSALADGAISVEEAGQLLDAVDRSGPDASGV